MTNFWKNSLLTLHTHTTRFVMIVVIAFASHISHFAFASFFSMDTVPMYAKCTFGYETTISEQDAVAIRTVGEGCYEICDTACKTAFKITSVDPNDTNNNEAELMQLIKDRNMNLIEQCFKNCVSGAQFNTDQAVMPSTDTNNESFFSTSNTKVCQINDASRVDQFSPDWPYKVDIRVSQGDKVSLALIPGDVSASESDQLIEDVDDSVYLCGYQSKIIFPKPYSTDNSISAAAQGATTDPWNGAVSDPYQSDNSTWHARMASWYNTKIYPHDGDFLSITYGGQFLNCAAQLNKETSSLPQTCYNPANKKTGQCSASSTCIFTTIKPASGCIVNLINKCPTDNKHCCYYASPCPYCTYGKAATNYGNLGDKSQYTLNFASIYNLQILNPTNVLEAWIDGFGVNPSKHFTLKGENISNATYFIDSDADIFSSKNDPNGTNIQTALVAAQAVDENINSNIDKNVIIGLTGLSAFDNRIYTSDAKTVYNLRQNAQIDALNNSAAMGCGANHHDYNHRMYRVQTFAGYLNGYSSSMATLGIKHYNPTNDSSSWSSNVGGYVVKTKWRGCRYQMGQRLQYIVVPEEQVADANALPIYLANAKNWHDINVTAPDQKTGSIAVIDVPNFQSSPQPQKPSKGFIFLRIKTLTTAEATALKLVQDCKINTITSSTYKSNCKKTWFHHPLASCDNAQNRCNEARSYAQSATTYARSNTTGKYSITATKIIVPDPKEVCGIGSGMVKMFCQTLMGRYCHIDDTDYCKNHTCNKPDCQYCGPGDSGSIVENTFRVLTKDSQLIAIVRALLLLFITWIGLSIALGLTKMQNKESILLIIKVGIITTLIGPNSWDFFYNVIFRAIFEGMQDLMNIFTYRLPNAPAKAPCIQWLPIMVSFDDMLDQLKSDANWVRILSMLLSSLSGMIFAIFLVVGFCFAFLAIIKSMLIIIMGIISISIMVITAPLFISFILFKHTSDMTKKWFKQLLIFMLEPVLVCGAVSLFISIMIILFKAIMSFTFCTVCFIKLDLIAFSLCVGHRPLPLFHMHSPDPFYTPMSVACGILILGLLCHTMYILPSMVSGVVQRIIEITAVSLEGTASFRNITTAIAKPIRGVSKAMTLRGDIISTITGRDEKSREERKQSVQDKANKHNSEKSETASMDKLISSRSSGQKK